MLKNVSLVTPTLSAVLITKNEAVNLPDCLASLSFCDEIIVLDNGSEDQTTDIAASFGAKVIRTGTWLGFGPQKQRSLDLTTGKWILSIDADERISETLKSEILKVVEEDGDSSYSFLRRNFFLGRQMKFGGWSGDRVVRLAKRGYCRFTSDVVHESLACVHPMRNLSGALVHISYRTVDEVFKKQIRYAELGASKLLVSGRSTKFPTARAIWTFTRLFFFQLGFLDGWRGTMAATAKSYETFWRYALASKRC